MDIFRLKTRFFVVLMWSFCKISNKMMVFSFKLYMGDEISGGRNQVKIYAIGSKKVKQSRKYPMFSPGHCPGLAEARSGYG